MTGTVPCPECHRPAQVLDSITSDRATGPVGYLRVQCEGPPSFLVNVEELDDRQQQQLPTDPADPIDGAA